MLEEIKRLVECLKKGGVMLYPTDTIWGLGCDAANVSAIERILEIKKRPEEKGLILLVDSMDRLRQYVPYIPAKAANLIEFHQRPLTIIYEGVQHIPAIACAPDGSAAIRVCKDNFCKKLLAEFGGAIVSTSANLSGEAFGGSFSDINEALLMQVDAIAEHRREEKINAQPSTIVRIDGHGDLVFIRK